MTENENPKSEERFRQIAETIAAVFWLADAVEPKILYVSPAYEQVWGRDRERLYTHYEEFFESIHLDDRERVRSAASRCMVQAQFETEYRVVRPDGEIRWVRDRGFLIRDQTGAPFQIAGFAEDVTDAKHLEHDRTRVEAALRVSEERLQTAQRAGNVGIWDWDAATGKTYWSETMWTLYGYESPPDQTGDEIWDLRQHPEDQPRIKAGMAQFLASNETNYRNEFRIIQPNGSVRWIEAVAQLVRDAAGNPVRMSGVNLDITDRKQAEIALAQSRYQFEKIAATTPDLVYVFDLVEERNIYVNAGIERILGYSPAQIVSLGASLIESLIHPDDIPSVIEGNQRFRDLDDQEVYDHELRMRHADGKYRWLRCRDTVFERIADGTVTQIIGTAQDITDRKHQEANLAFLAEVSQDLMWLTNIAETMDAIGAKIGRHFNLSLCTFAEIDEQSNTATVAHGWSRPDTPSILGVHRLSDYISGEMLQAARVGETIVIRDVQSDRRVDADYTARLNIASFISVPLQRGGQLFFALTIYDSIPRDWREDEIELMRELAARIWTRLERARAEAALQESESRLRLMIDSAKEYAIFTLDLGGRVTSWNFGAERLLGYSEAEILESSGRIIFTPEDNAQGKAEREMHLALTEGQAENKRWHVRKDGSWFWGTGFVMPLRSGDDVIHGFIKIMRDETSQRQAEERFQILYDTTSDLLATEQPLTLMHNLFSNLSTQLDLDYYFNYIVQEKNDRLMLHLKNYQGLRADAAQAIEWIEFGQDLCGLVAQERQQLVLDQQQIIHHPNGQLYRSLGVTAYAGQPLIVQGRLLGTLCFASRRRTHFTPDETNLLQSVCDQMAIALERNNLLNSIQQQSEQLQRANQIKDEFLAVLSHELRSPLNPILGWAKLLQEGNLDATRTTTALNIIERNAQLQSQLINDLLDISRILRGKLSLEQESVDLRLVIASALETVRLAAEAKSLQIETIVPLNVRTVLGDAGRLQQVVWNLLSNAVKFTPNDGQITVALTQTNTHAQIQVTDTGKGIDPSFLPYVFEHFRQEDGATTRKFGGLGLGLAIARQIVELHGGQISVDSLGEGQGATFTVKLPVLGSQGDEVGRWGDGEALSTQHSALSTPLAGLQILVVDDEPDSRDFVAFVLEQAGAIVISVASGIEALQIIEQSVPDLIVSDIGMPEMDGYMLLQQVRAGLPAKQVPAIALTAYAGEIDQQQALAAGFQQHITKPVEPEKLVRTVGILTSRDNDG